MSFDIDEALRTPAFRKENTRYFLVREVNGVEERDPVVYYEGGFNLCDECRERVRYYCTHIFLQRVEDIHRSLPRGVKLIIEGGTYGAPFDPYNDGDLPFSYARDLGYRPGTTDAATTADDLMTAGLPAFNKSDPKRVKQEGYTPYMYPPTGGRVEIPRTFANLVDYRYNKPRWWE